MFTGFGFWQQNINGLFLCQHAKMHMFTHYYFLGKLMVNMQKMHNLWPKYWVFQRWIVPQGSYQVKFHSLARVLGNIEKQLNNISFIPNSTLENPNSWRWAGSIVMNKQGKKSLKIELRYTIRSSGLLIIQATTKEKWNKDF